jgi:capsular polysaccharide biosynthesis protein
MVEHPTSRNGTSAPTTAGGSAADAPVDLSRVTGAIRRDYRLVAAIVVIVTGVVVLVSVLSPVRYRADARIADEPLASGTADPSAVDRRLATSRELAATPPVLAAAARQVRGETAETLRDKVSATVDPATSILDIAATDSDPRHAADVANAVAQTFLAERERQERLVLSQAQERLTKELEDQRRRGAKRATIDALRSRLGDIAATGVMVGSGLRLVQEATAPSAPYAPRPLRSALVALLASLLVAVLVAVARDRLRRRGPDAQTLSRAVELPLIAALPATDVRRRRRRDPGVVDGEVIEEAALQAAVRAALPPRGQRVVLVHGTRPDDGPARVAAALARSLSWAGHATALVVVESPGRRPATVHSPGPDVPVVRCVHVDEQLQELKEADYRYMVVATPPGAPGAQLRELAAHTSATILVARLGATSVEDAVAARRLMRALGLDGLGLVVTCAIEDGPAITRAGFAAPLQPRPRARGSAHNGAHAGEMRDDAPVPAPAPDVEQ